MESKSAHKNNPLGAENARFLADCFVLSELKTYFFVHKIVALYFTHISS